MTQYQVIVDGATATDEHTAGEVMRSICEAYPGHPWHVQVRDGILTIKHMRMSAKWGMNKRLSEIFSISDLKRSAVMAAGEWLERANVYRGRDQGDQIVQVEGIEKKDLLLG